MGRDGRLLLLAWPILRLSGSCLLYLAPFLLFDKAESSGVLNSLVAVPTTGPIPGTPKTALRERAPYSLGGLYFNTTHTSAPPEILFQKPTFLCHSIDSHGTRSFRNTNRISMPFFSKLVSYANDVHAMKPTHNIPEDQTRAKIRGTRGSGWSAIPTRLKMASPPRRHPATVAIRPSSMAKKRFITICTNFVWLPHRQPTYRDLQMIGAIPLLVLV